MTVRNGDLANETTFNEAYFSKKEVSTGVGIIIESTTEASKPWPTMTTVERDALTPVNGFAIYNSDDDTLQVYNGTTWDNQDSVESVNGYTGAVILDADDLDDTATINKFITQTERDKLTGIEAGAQVNAVDSVAGKTGVVTLDKNDVGLDQVDNLSLQTHIDTNPAHKEIDTKANLDVWAATASNGAEAFSTDEKKAYHVVDGVLEEMGGGTGTGVGSPGIYKLFNAEDADLTDFTNISINTTNPINGLADYSVDSYPATLPNVTPFNRNVGKRNTLSFQYEITSGTASVTIAGVTVNIDNTNTRAVVEYDVANLTPLTITIADVSSATGLRLDDLVFSDEPREVKNFTKTENITYTGFISKGAGDYVKFKTELENSGSEIVSVDNSGDRTTYTLLKDADVVVSSSLFSLDSSQYNMKIEVYDAGNSLVLDGISRNEYHGNVSLTIKGKAGYFFLVDAETRNPSDVLDTNFSIQATATSSGTVFASDTAGSRSSYINVDATKNTAQGGATTSYKTRDLIDYDGDIPLVISANQVTIPKGSYDIEIPVGSYLGAAWVSVQIYDVTNSTVLEQFADVAYSITTAVTFNTAKGSFVFNEDTTLRFETKASDASGSEFIGRIKIKDNSVNVDNLIIDQFKVMTIDDGVLAPTAIVGKAQLYVDNADGDLKVIFGNGTVKTIATNP